MSNIASQFTHLLTYSLTASRPGVGMLTVGHQCLPRSPKISTVVCKLDWLCTLNFYLGIERVHTSVYPSGSPTLRQVQTHLAMYIRSAIFKLGISTSIEMGVFRCTRSGTLAAPLAPYLHSRNACDPAYRSWLFASSAAAAMAWLLLR